jgi:hypothetical protein
MPKYIKTILKSVQKFISNFYKTVFKLSTMATLMLAVVITSFWTHNSFAEAPLLFGGESATISEKLVDGLTVAERAAKIDAFYVAEGDLPLAGHGYAFVQAADKYGVDWRLLPAIGYLESTGGQHDCKRVTYSPFGYGSCKINFSSYEDAIEVTLKNISGNNPKTAKYYAGKDTAGILSAYNQVRSDYKKIIYKTMDEIATIDAPTILAMK